MSIRITCSTTENVGLAYHQNSVPFIREIVLQNVGECDLRDLRLAITSEPAALRPFELRIDAIAAGGVVHLEAPDVRLDPTLLSGLTETVPLELSIAIHGPAEETWREAATLRLLPPSHWGGGRSAPELVAAFVRPNDPSIDVVLHDAAVKLGAAGRPTGLDGYGDGRKTRAWDIAAAVWAALADRRIVYALPPASFESSGQKIRAPTDVLDRGVGTCLDLTLLYAAAIEQAGLDPLVVLVQGHAFAGVWLQKAAVADLTIDDMQVLRKRRDLQELVLVETTLLTGTPSADFAAAVARGAAGVEEDAAPLDVAIDMRRARTRGIRPMDLGASGAAISPATVEALPQSLAAAPAFRDEVSAVEVEDDATDRLERWKRRLLDLTLRNKLLNFKTGKAVVAIDCADPAILEDRLAEGKAFRLVGRRDDDAGRREPEEGRERRIADALDRGELNVALEEKELSDRLLNLYRLSRNAFEEGGANILFLAVGFLQWKRTDDEEAHRAPLLLVPVALKRSSARAGFRLSLHDDEARVNPTLVELLRQEFKLRIPMVEGDLPRDASGLDVARILDAVRAGVRDLRGWEVEGGVALTTLSFSTYLMWRDLVDRADTLKRNPVVRHLLETPKHAYGDGAAFPDPMRLDVDHPPDRVFAPLAADSSQLSAVLAAAQGRDFVLFGPPGTGKSQTICNIIAQCLAEGRTVLFVSQKTAALEVVQRRLESIGLGSHCLEVHSAKAQKSAVLTKLGQAWRDNARTKAPGWAQATADLASTRSALNRLVDSLHRRHTNGMTAYEGFGIVVASGAIGPFEFSWPDGREQTAADLASLRNLCGALRPVLAAVGDPSNHPLSGMGAFAWSPRWRQDMEATIDAFSTVLRRLDVAATRFAELVRLGPLLQTCEGVRDLVAIGTRLVDPIAANGVHILSDDAGRLVAQVEARDRFRAETSRLMARTAGRYRDGVLDLDLPGLLDAWLAARNANFLVRGGRTKLVASRLAIYVEGSLPADLGRDLAILIETAQHVAKGCREADALVAMGPPWSDPDLSAASFAPALAWAKDAEGAFEPASRRGDWRAPARGHIAAVLADEPKRFGEGGSVRLAHAALESAWTAAASATEALRRLAAFGDASPLPLGAGWIAGCLAIAERWRGGLGRAQGWSAWREAALQADAAGLGPLVWALEEGRVAPERIEAEFDAAHARWWIDALVSRDDTLRRFVPERHEDAIARFRALDARVAELSKLAIRSRLGGGVPGPNAFGSDPEWGLLSRELTKRKAHVPLRKLFAGMPRALTSLTPCLMMSPLSIAQYLPPDAPPFDVVVFDEASQMAPWHAIGAMARGRQLVIVGDPEQLPPTSVGDRGADDIEDGTDVADQESILDECLAANVPRRNLDWHYRSRHEALIAFSNERYYGGRLVTFPSPATDDRAVRLVHVPDGLYERGAGRVNRPEARAVTEWVVGRLLDPDFAARNLSLGIVTFNGEQQRLVENLLDERRRAEPDLERFFDGDRWNEPVFVKNLENVQGDERDVIVFSVAVGRDASGRVSSTVSSLNKQGGHRRLNVAVTRARSELVVFSSLRASDIDLGRSGARGVRDFKHFLDYAERGPRALAEAAAPTGAAVGSPFEAAVKAGLEARGWVVHPQVGCSGFRIDLGVLHPDEPGRYLAGVECDGATYHRAATARDRDRLREMVLVGLGWRMQRVWSPEWWADPAAALDKIDRRLTLDLAEDRRAAAARAATSAVVAEDDEPGPDGAETISPVAVEDPSESAETGPGTGRTTTSAASPADARPPGGSEPATAFEPAYAELAMGGPVASEASAPEAVADTPYLVANPEHCGVGIAPERFYDPSYRRTLDVLVAHVIACEAPLFEDVLVRRIARAHGFGRAGRTVRETILGSVDAGCARSEEDGQGVIWPVGEMPAPVRAYRPAPAGVRSHADIPLAELAGLALAVRTRRPDGDPVRGMAAELGLSRLEAATQIRFDRAMAVLPPDGMT